METLSVEMGVWPGIGYGVLLAAFVGLMAWRDAKKGRRV